jgi:hypothetical protein
MPRYFGWFAVAALCGLFEVVPSQAASVATVIVCPKTAAFAERLAAKEIRRYVYLRCGELLPIAGAQGKEADSIVLKTDPALSPEEYQLQTTDAGGRRVLTISGGSPIAVLYGAYHFAEKLGVRFYLHGDVVPDQRISLCLPVLDERHKPLFATRGIQPFHDFPEGPDWWNRDDYQAYVTQLAKLKMNFLGLHTYPEHGPNPEPLVWIGLPRDVNPDGTVKFSYNSYWANTLRNGAWGYAALKTSDFTCGAAQLFPDDAYGPDVMKGLMPHPNTPEQCNELFNRTGTEFRAVFMLAHKLGVKTCIGTETPLTIPDAVRERLKQLGKDPADPAVVRELYDGIFKRIATIGAVDYYWLWTPEGWTWGGNDPKQFAATTRDIRAAYDALAAAGRFCTLATCGWVLGPQHDRAALDAFLPKECPMSCINRSVGYDPVEAAFANIQGRPKWAIPWMENDPNLVAYQPWAGRMRHDAVDAKRLGCDGLLGIHWRTKALSPNVSALAGAAWEQSWVPDAYDTSPVKPTESSQAYRQVKKPLNQRAMPIGAFYEDFARAHFGAAVAAEAGKILAAVDGAGSLPNPSDWLTGPGDLKTNAAPLDQVKKRFEHVAQFEALRGKVAGAGNRERFDYWSSMLKRNAVMCEIACIRGQLDAAVKKINAEKTADGKRRAAREALPIRIALVRKWDDLMTCQIAAVSTPGELGTIANLEQHSRVRAGYLTGFDPVLTAALGKPLPQECAPSREYAGPARLIVPTVRTSVAKGEALELRIIALDREPVKAVTVRVRPMGGGNWQEIAAGHVARGAYEAALPVATDDFEYHLVAETAEGKTLRWPAAAPAVSQTVVVLDP